MKNLFTTLYETLQKGQSAVLVSVVASSGSTPRGAGAKMLVFEDGSTLGTIGGGAVEYESEKLAMEVHQTKQSYAKGFVLAPNQVADLGMICGGNVTVYFQHFAGADGEAAALVGYICSLFDRDENGWLVTAMRDGAVWSMGVYHQQEGLQFAQGLDEAAVLPLVKSRAVLQKGEEQIYVEPLTRAGRVYVFGGGHVAQELVPAMARVGFRPVVFEDRPKFCEPALFPHAEEIVQGDFADIAASVSIGPSDYVVIMTRGHQMDYEVLEQTLRTPASYVGVIGSKHKIADTRSRLLAAGLTETEIERIHTPIGLAIQAETPAEIAVSITAELILHRAQNR